MYGMYGGGRGFGGMDPAMIMAFMIGAAIVAILVCVFLVWGDGGRRWDQESTRGP